MRKHGVVFAGFEHPHLTDIYKEIKENEAFEICGTWEADEGTRNIASKKGVVFTHTDYESLLNEPNADTVAIGAHFSARGSLAIEALKAGKNIIIDKPICTETDELNEIERLAAEKRLAVCVLLSLRYSPNILAAVTAVKNGAVGKVNNIVFEGEHPLDYGKRATWYFEKGKHGGTINDIAVHGIDLVLQMTGSNVKTVNAAREWNFFAPEVPHFKDSAQFMLTLESGAGVIADVSYSAPNASGYSHPSYWHFRVFGEDGMIEFGENIDKVTLFPKDRQPETISPLIPKKDMLEDFLDAASGSIDVIEYNRSMLEASRQTLIIEKSAEVM